MIGGGAPSGTLARQPALARSSTRGATGLLYGWMAASDCLGVAVALLLAYQVRFGRLWPPADVVALLALGAPIAAGFNLAFGLYRVHRFSSAEEFRRLLLANTMTVTAAVMLGFWSPVTASRLWVAEAWLFTVLLALAVRRAWHWWMRRAWAMDRYRLRTLIIGGNDEAERLASLLAHGKVGFRLVGMVATSASEGDGRDTLGTVRDLRSIIRRTGAECVFIAASAVRSEDITHVLQARRMDGVEVRVTANFPAMMLTTTRVTPQAVGGLLVLSVGAARLTRAQAAAKRAFDILLAGVGLLLTAPLLAALALGIRLTSPGPVLYRQERVGLRGGRFTLLKLRTMVDGADRAREGLGLRSDVAGPLFKLRDDPRVTRVGRWLRRHSLDEIPQLWNVLKGEMSMVGPRPPLPSEVAAYREWQLDRLEVRPGLTGLWQVSGRSELSFDEYVRLDLFYIDNWSLAYDLFIVVKTIPIVLSRRGAY